MMLRSFTLGLLTATAITLAAPAVGIAAEVPAASRFDGRIRFVSYNPDDVVTVTTAAGNATTIVFEEGEEYRNHVFGDAAAWSFAEVERGIAIKPVAEKADTNLTVFTDRRIYVFELRYLPSKDAQGVFLLTFKYPETAKKAAVAAQEAKALQAAFSAPPKNANLSYEKAGDLSLAPVNVWDDGKFTYFKFSENQDIPAIYMVDADGSESIVNRNSSTQSNDVIVMQKVNEKWRLRLGRQVVTIFNRQLEDGPISTAPRLHIDTGTASASVQRIIKGGSDQ